MAYYDKDGTPICLYTWGRLMGDWEYKRIGKTILSFSDGHVIVSTVWLGLDHSFHAGTLHIFETMVFGGRFDEFQWRYSTAEQARLGHQLAVEAIRLDRSPDRALLAKLA